MYQVQKVNKWGIRQPKHRLLSLTVGEFLIFVGLNLLLFQVALQPIYPIAGYFDEAASVLLAVVAFFGSSTSLSKQLRAAMALFGCFVAACILSSLMSGVNVSQTASLIDLYTCSKFAITLWASYRLFVRSDSLFKLLQSEAKLLLAVLLVLAIINLIVDIGVGADGDFGISRAFRFVYYHPSAVVWLSVALVSTLLFDIKENRVYIVFGLLVACSTLTSKGIGWAVAIAVVMCLMNRRGHISVVSLGLSIAAVIVSAWSSILLYYSNEMVTTARSVLLITSFDIARMFFPFGSGFATFGSAVTADPLFYSPLYYYFGLDSIWGLTPMNPTYFSDTFWPIVVAQSGYIGAACFVGFATCLVWACFRFDGRASRAWLPSLCIVGYLILGSVAESSFFNPASVYLSVLLGMFFGRESLKQKEV